jgi:hypothetical protein
VPSWHTTVVPPFWGTTTVVFCGGEGLLLLIQPASIDAATSKLASTFIILPPWILRRVNDSSMAAILRAGTGVRQGWIARVLVAARPTVGAIAPTSTVMLTGSQGQGG